jgi:hypothetical protein
MLPSLESLSPEMFNQVRSHLIGEAFYALAKSYLDGNAWVKFRINHERLLCDPNAVGVRTFTIPNLRVATLPVALEVDIRFPNPERPHPNDHNNQHQTTCLIGHPTNAWSYTVLVLAADVPDFLQCIRLQDLTYCARIDYSITFWTPLVADIRTPSRAPASGLSYTFRVFDRAYNVALSLAQQFAKTNGSFHTGDVVSASPDMQSIKHAIEKPHTFLDAVAHSGIEVVLWVKSQMNAAFDKGDYARFHNLAPWFGLFWRSY